MNCDAQSRKCELIKEVLDMVDKCAMGFPCLKKRLSQSPQLSGPISFQLLVWVPCKPPTPGRTACLETVLPKVYKPRGLMRKLPLLSYNGPFSLRKGTGAATHR